MDTGQHGSYWWLSSADGRMWSVLSAMPDLVVGKYVVVTAFDAGPLQLTETERRAGWRQSGKAAVSPLVVDPDMIPSDATYDEWYVFEDAVPSFEGVESFVNFGFSPVSPGAMASYPAQDSVARRAVEERQAQFWATLERLHPFLYLSEGQVLTLATTSESVRERARTHAAPHL